MTLRQLASDIFQIDRVLAVLLTANSMILSYFHAHFPEYVVIASTVLAGVAIFVAVSSKIATILSAASVTKTQISTGQSTGPVNP